MNGRPMVDSALEAHACGLAVIPPTEDGVKRPDVGGWTQYQVIRPTTDELLAWYGERVRTGIGLVTGRVSGGLEMLEFEGRAVAEVVQADFRQLVMAAGLGPVLDRIMTGYLEKTPRGGFHLLYRVPTALANTKLASRPATPEELADKPTEPKKVLIETRGEGGYVIVAPSNGRVHPEGGAWTLERGGFASIATITDQERDGLFRIARMLDQLPLAVPPESRSAQVGGDRPGDRYNAAPDVQARTEELLERHGWTFVHRDKQGAAHLRRPGKPAPGTSASVSPSGVVNVFTTSDAHLEEGPHSPFSVYGILEHGGDWSAAARALEPGVRIGFGDPPGPRTKTEGAPRLPEAFWTARPVLERIRTAARSRQRAPDAVLGATLARVAALVPHTLGLPAIVGSEAGLSLLVAIVAPPGLGKSDSNRIAGELVPGGPDLVEIPSGSGEGLAEALFEFVDVVGPNGKPRKDKVQTRHNLLCYVDEGQRATRQAAQTGSTLFATWRSIFTGATIGEANASTERRRVVPAGTYSVGLLAAFQPEALGPLFEDLAVGTPSRFLYLAGSDPTLPDDPPPWPGGLAFELPDLAGAQTMLFALRRQHLRIVDPVAAEIRAADLARQRGAGDADPWHAHRNLLRLKVAALLAILDGRLMANEEDWGLAGLMVDTSDAVRQAVQDQLGDEEQRRESQTATRLARRAVTTEATLDNHRTQDAAKRLWQMATKWPGAKTPGQARVGLAGAQRAYYEAARDHAVDAGWIEVRGEAGQGSDKVRLWPGANRP